MRSVYAEPRERRPLFESYETVLGLLLAAAGWLGSYVARVRYHFTGRQIIELATYVLLGLLAVGWPVYRMLTARSRREKEWPHPPLTIVPHRDERAIHEAWSQSAVVLGYDVHGKPWLWPDRVRVMQGIVLGMTGTGKTTLLRNIITQDLCRTTGPASNRHRIPMVIFDGKGDMEFFHSLLPHIHRAGRLRDLRVLNPARPDISVRYNPFHCGDEDYMPVVNMVFGSFNLHDEFFAKHQLNYLADIVRVLVYTGLKFNFYDVLVMAIDEQVLREQVAKASRRLEQADNVGTQRRLNFEMSVKNLYESFQDRERVPKIQGLLNECMTFLDDELSVITGPYEELLSLDDVIEHELILFVTLNVNKNTEPVRALGKMLLQNLQLVVGKRYESDAHRRRVNTPLFSVVLDEFAPFGYRNFPQILQTARGTNTAFLFSMQSLPQLMHVGRGFKEDVTSAPNTTITMRTRDEETAHYFLRASAEHRVTRRNLSMERWRLFGLEHYEETGRAVDIEARETRSLDEHIKNLPKGQMEILMTDDTRGTLHAHLHVRAPADVMVPHFEPELYPRLRQSRAASQGANLRFKSSEFHGTRYARRGR
ncbi:MAG TPA: type IV secretory system conjugative DNA transfer family protein [Candidatus Acidoferrales bacterium]|nr:type IV secretory system conjugative DNA transfer family protein [Candidatus Acidoferrales bacterium]